MSFQLYIRPEAEEDIEDATAWYEAQRFGLGHEFLDEVFRCLKLLAKQPALYPTLHRNTHRSLVHRFPFGVYYRIDDDFIIVVAVMHGSRDPQHWKQRT